jgi:hypothetical protein
MKNYKTYCWVCKKKVLMAEPTRSINKPSLLVGYCLVCGTQIYKYLKGGLMKDGKEKYMRC